MAARPRRPRLCPIVVILLGRVAAPSAPSPTVFARIERARARARSEAGAAHASTLSLYTRTCQRLYAGAGGERLPDALELPCAPSDLNLTLRSRPLVGRRAWTREGLCYGSYYEMGQNELKTDGLVGYASVHKAGSRSHTTLYAENGTVVHKLKPRKMEHCNPQRLVPRHADPTAFFAFTTVREPIDRFVSAYNTMLSATEGTTVRRGWARPEPAPRPPACERKLELMHEYVDGMLAPYAQRVPESGRYARLRYDSHVGSQLHDLGCTLPPDALRAAALGPAGVAEPGRPRTSARGGPLEPGWLRLGAIVKLETPTRRKSVRLRAVPYGHGSPRAELKELGTARLAGNWIARVGERTSQVACRLTRADLDPAVVRQLCEYYAQDFVCLDYPLPPECSAGPSQLRSGGR